MAAQGAEDIPAHFVFARCVQGMAAGMGVIAVLAGSAAIAQQPNGELQNGVIVLRGSGPLESSPDVGTTSPQRSAPSEPTPEAGTPIFSQPELSSFCAVLARSNRGGKPETKLRAQVCGDAKY